MPSVTSVDIHHSQFPTQLSADLLDSLRTREINHKFHYDSHRQIHRWLALHEAHSPARNDPDAQLEYTDCFQEIASQLDGEEVIHVISLGCGGGQKDLLLLQELARPGRRLDYTPVDVTPAMTLGAREAASTAIPADACHPLVCDLATADDLPEILDARVALEARRVVLFFGMIPNFEPNDILPKLAALLRGHDLLLISANLAPGDDYDAGLRTVLPQYDNHLTREWLATLPNDLGIEAAPGDIQFEIAGCPDAPEVKRIEATLTLSADATIHIDGQTVRIPADQALRLFFSCRFTPNLLAAQLLRHELKISRTWIASSGEEGIFQAKKQTSKACALEPICQNPAS